MITLTGINAAGTVFTAESNGNRLAWIFGRGMLQLNSAGEHDAFLSGASLTSVDEQFSSETELWAWVAEWAGADWPGPHGAEIPDVEPAMSPAEIEELLG